MSDAPSGVAPIVVGVDFSRGCEAALAWAADAAIAFGAPLLVLHVAHDPAERPGSYVRSADLASGEIEQVAVEWLAQFMAEVRERVPRLAEVDGLETRVVVGLPVSRILEVAEQEGASGIVMGATGHTALADVLLGSKVDGVTRLSPIPVTIVRPPSEPDEEGEVAASPGDGDGR